jgi:hypothetical protein
MPEIPATEGSGLDWDVLDGYIATFDPITRETTITDTLTAEERANFEAFYFKCFGQPHPSAIPQKPDCSSPTGAGGR